MKGKALAALLVATLFGCMLAGCSSGTPGTSNSPSQPAKTTMTIATPQSSSTLDPLNAYDGWYMLRYGVCETLFKFSEDMTPKGWLAEDEYTLSDDKLTWTFVIKDGITFSNGNPLTADAVKSCIERALETSTVASNYFTVQEIKADGQTLSITTKEPTPTLMYTLGDPIFCIYDTSADLTDIATKGPIGTGPFVFDSFDSVTHDTSVVRNENYWDGAVQLEKIDFQIVTDTSTMYMAFTNHDVDAAYSIDTAHIEDASSNPEATLETSVSGRTTFAFMNQSEGQALADEALRQAVISACDRETYCSSLLKGQFVAGKTPLTSSLPYGYEDLNDINAYDPDRAKSILDEAGYKDTDGDGYVETPDGDQLTITVVIYNSRAEIPVLAQAMQNDLKKVGIRMEINDVAQEAAWNMLTTGEYQMLMMSISMASAGDPEANLRSYFYTYSDDEQNYNMSGYSNPEVDAAFDRLATTFEVAERQDLIKDIEQRLMDDSACLYLCYPVMNFVVQKDVSGVTSHVSDYYWVSKDTCFTQ